MTFKVFKEKIDAIIAKTITGCPSGRKVTVRYGSGHQMMAAI